MPSHEQGIFLYFLLQLTNEETHLMFQLVFICRETNYFYKLISFISQSIWCPYFWILLGNPLNLFMKLKWHRSCLRFGKHGRFSKKSILWYKMSYYTNYHNKHNWAETMSIRPPPCGISLLWHLERCYAYGADILLLRAVWRAIRI